MKKKNNSFLIAIMFIILATVQYTLLESSVITVKAVFFHESWVYTIVGVATILFFDVLVAAIFRKRALALNVLNIAFLLFVFVSYFTFKYHGSAFTFIEIKNASTAASVISPYIKDMLSFNKKYVIFFCLFAVSVATTLIIGKISPEGRNSRRLPAIILALTTCFLIKAYFILPIIPKDAVVWSWEESIKQYGFIPSLVQETRCEFNPVSKPEGYSREKVSELVSDYTEESDQSNTPDIIVILNESFYDLNQIIDVDNDENPISYINNLDNSIYGYAISPKACGGTNMSEYELLTSNSMGIMAKNITPFNSLDLTNSNSVVSHLESLGYETFATHIAAGSNYNRIVGYDALGFDTVFFKDEYHDLEKYGERGSRFTDASVYRNLIEWYEEMSDKPRFMYCLTIQNHGEYNSNPSEYDLVHTARDFGDYTDIIDEYNSCVYLSDKAFKELVDYYSNSDRDVIILMVGDHCPDYVPDLYEKYGDGKDESKLNLVERSVPYIMWSNNDALVKGGLESERISMFYLIPTLLDKAGVELSGYYEELLALKENAPIIAEYGKYYDVNMNENDFNDDSKGWKRVQDYFYLEYSNVMLDYDKKDEAFF